MGLDYVSRNSEEFGWQGKRVLELGAGTGLVAISLALEGASGIMGPPAEEPGEARGAGDFLTSTLEMLNK